MVPIQYLLGAFVTLLVFSMGQLGMAIWFASRLNAQVSNIAADVGELMKDAKDYLKTQAKVDFFDARIVALEQRDRQPQPSSTGRRK